jgi:hypothetical protein
MKNKIIRAQCISTNSGFHSSLERGRWYDVEEYNTNLYLVYYPFISESYLYEKKLFRTLDEKRDYRLNKILK